MEDTAENRLKAVEMSVFGDFAQDLEFMCIDIEKYPIERLRFVVLQASQMISNVYNIAHGFNSECCQGSHLALAESFYKEYRG